MANYIPAKLADSVPKILVALSLVAGVFSLFFSWVIRAKFHLDIPFEDTVRLLPIVQSFVENGWSGVTLQEWVSPHSGHRIAVGRLLMAMEYKYLAGGNSLFYLGSWLSIAVLCYLYGKVAKVSDPENTDLSLFMLGMALVYICSYSQTYNLVIPINSLWYIGAASSALSIYLLLIPDRNPTLFRAVGSCLFAMLAAFSVFSGVIACLVTALLALLCRSKHALWILLVMLAFVIVYTQDLKSGQQLVLERMSNKSVDVTLDMHIQSFVANREKLFLYTVAFLSSPLSKSPTLLSYIYVIPSFCLILYGWVALLRQWFTGESRGREAAIFYLAIATIALGTALACFFGRGFFNEPTAPRYQTIAMLYWLSVSGLLLYTLPGRNDPRIKAAYMILVLLMPIGLFYKQSEFKILSVLNKANSANDTEIRARLGLPDFRDAAVPANRFTPEYIKFESFLSEHSRLTADSISETAPNNDEPEACNAIRLRIQPDAINTDRLRNVKLVADGNEIQRYRRIRIAGPDGGRGYLYPTPTGPMSITKLLWDDTSWKGYYRGNLDSSPVTLIFESILGPDFKCRLPANSRQPPAGE